MQENKNVIHFTPKPTLFYNQRENVSRLTGFSIQPNTHKCVKMFFVTFSIVPYIASDVKQQFLNFQTSKVKKPKFYISIVFLVPTNGVSNKPTPFHKHPSFQNSFHSECLPLFHSPAYFVGSVRIILSISTSIYADECLSIKDLAINNVSIVEHVFLLWTTWFLLNHKS